MSLDESIKKLKEKDVVREQLETAIVLLFDNSSTI